ncbi:MAG: polyphosphate kinase [Rhizobiaceae bacterium]
MNRKKTAGKTPLDSVDMSASLSQAAHDRKLRELQRTLARIQQSYLLNGHTGVIVVEGWDAGGKGGTIRRIAEALDPRSFKVWPIGAPRNYYLQRHFLLRFMERLPPTGAISVFDRSWYGRVLVERVEKLTPEHRWRQAYDEINNFEQMLANDDTRLVKLFFHITPEEQLARFEKRLRSPMKRWKLTYEDFRNRSRWPDYEAAINDMLRRTSTSHAPWTIIPANDKKHARIAAISEVVRCFSRDIDLSPPDLDERVLKEANNHFDLEPSLVESLKGRTE